MLRGHETRLSIFHALVGLVRFPYKAHQDKLRQTRVFASCGICGSRSAFRCIWGGKRRFTIFHARTGLVGIPQKVHWDMLRRTCVLQPVGRAGHVVQYGASGAGNIDALFFMLVWDQ
jgi:hypothetical protein